jgi:hypothetical protein
VNATPCRSLAREELHLRLAVDIAQPTASANAVDFPGLNALLSIIVRAVAKTRVVLHGTAVHLGLIDARCFALCRCRLERRPRAARTELADVGLCTAGYSDEHCKKGAHGAQAKHDRSRSLRHALRSSENGSKISRLARQKVAARKKRKRVSLGTNRIEPQSVRFSIARSIPRREDGHV